MVNIMDNMPHAGLIDESLGKGEALLMRARLHVRGSHIRFSEGRSRDGVAAMYDAISSAMQMFTQPELVKEYPLLMEDEDPSDDFMLFQILKRSGIFDESVSLADFTFLAECLDDALENKMDAFDETKFVETSHILLMQLGVLPFNECDLPDSVTL
jgi:hypothetical protein